MLACEVTSDVNDAKSRRDRRNTWDVLCLQSCDTREKKHMGCLVSQETHGMSCVTRPCLKDIGCLVSQETHGMSCVTKQKKHMGCLVSQDCTLHDAKSEGLVRGKCGRLRDLDFDDTPSQMGRLKKTLMCLDVGSRPINVRFGGRAN